MRTLFRMTMTEQFKLGKLIEAAGNGFAPDEIAKQYNRTEPDKNRHVDIVRVIKSAEAIGVQPKQKAGGKHTPIHGETYGQLCERVRRVDAKQDQILAKLDAALQAMGVTPEHPVDRIAVYELNGQAVQHAA